MGNIYGGNKASIFLSVAFAKFAEAGLNGNTTDSQEQIETLVKAGHGPLRNLKEMFMQSCKKQMGHLSKSEYESLMTLICQNSELWFPAYICASDMSEQRKMEIIEHFTGNFSKISSKLEKKINPIYTLLDTKQKGFITWEQFARSFFGLALGAIQRAQEASMVAEVKQEQDAERVEQTLRTKELTTMFENILWRDNRTKCVRKSSGGEANYSINLESLSKSSEQNTFVERSKSEPGRLSIEETRVKTGDLLEAMERFVFTRMFSEIPQIKRIIQAYFDQMESLTDVKQLISKNQAVEKYLVEWIYVRRALDRLPMFLKGSYVEVYSKQRCRWELAIVQKQFVSEDYKIWVKLFIPSIEQSCRVDLINSEHELQPIKWARGLKVEVKHGNQFFPGVVILKKDSDSIRWVGMEYLDNNRELMRVRVDVKYCPRLFRPVTDDNGLRFGYGVRLSCVFFDVSLKTYRYILEIKGPKKSWRLAKNFSLMRSFWNSIKKPVEKHFGAEITFPKGRIVGCRDKEFITERKNQLATFWRRLSRMLHLIEDDLLQKVAKFLEIPIVSQKNYKKSIKPKLYIKLMRVENLPLIVDDLGKAKANHTYVRLKIKDEKQGIVDEEEWPCKADSSCPVWNSTRPLTTQGDRSTLIIEIWHDEQNKGSNLKIGKLSIGIKHLLHGPKTSMSVPLNRKVKPNPNGNCKAIIQIVDEPPKKKWLYLIRHAQSKWNAAKREFDLVTAFGIRDHGLTKIGANQAETLRKRMSRCEYGSEQGEAYANFYQAQKVYTSPLSRAVESAVLALRDHKCVKQDGIYLLADVREKRTLMGMDCTGQFKGKEILAHVQKEFKELLGEVQDTIKDVSILPNDAEHLWWSTKAESSMGFRSRLDEAMKNIIYDQAKSIVVVCHSMVIREIFKRYLSPDFFREDFALGSDLSNEKVQNMAVVGARLDTTKVQCIQHASLMFGSKVVKGKKEAKRTSLRSRHHSRAEEIPPPRIEKALSQGASSPSIRISARQITTSSKLKDLMADSPKAFRTKSELRERLGGGILSPSQSPCIKERALGHIETGQTGFSSRVSSKGPQWIGAPVSGSE